MGYNFTGVNIKNFLFPKQYYRGGNSYNTSFLHGRKKLSFSYKNYHKVGILCFPQLWEIK